MPAPRPPGRRRDENPFGYATFVIRVPFGVLTGHRECDRGGRADHMLAVRSELRQPFEVGAFTEDGEHPGPMPREVFRDDGPA
jgi:hypothetical protein